MKHFFGLMLALSISYLSVYADIDPANDVCGGSEEISEMHLISGNSNHEEGPGSFTKNGDAIDIYHFQINSTGTLELYLSADDDTNVYLGTAACGSNPIALDASVSGMAQTNIVSGQTVTVRLGRDKNENVAYGFDLIFKEAQAPVAIEDNVETYVDTAVDIDVTANDQDDGTINKGTVTILTDTSHGSTSINATTGVVTYTPNVGFSGLDNFTYTVRDNIGNVSNIISVLIIVKVPAVAAENCDLGTQNANRDFCLRKQTMLPGNMLTIGNTVLVAPGTEATNGSADCSTYTNGPYIDNATDNNDEYKLCQYIPGGAGTPPATSASVVIPDINNSTIEWAGLYWQALIADANVTDVLNMQIRIKNGTDTYETVGYDKLNYTDSGYSSTTAYSAFKNVTSILQTKNWKDGNYTVADIPVVEGEIDSLGTFGAWALVIIYRNDSESIRSFSVFDGWPLIKSSAGFNNVPIALSGFYTPKSGDINSTVSVFAAEGDKHRDGDTLTVEDANNANAEKTLYTNESDNTFDASINGVIARTPNPTNNNGIDIHTFDLGTSGADILTHEQSDLTFRFKSSEDQYWPSVLAFSTVVYTPSFCYDYAYQQNGVFFTEINDDPLRDPRITGFVTNGDDINVSLMILNREDSDVTAKNLKLAIEDINTTQAIYKRNTVSILNPEEVVPLAIADASLVVADDFIKDITYADVEGTQKIFTYYTLTPNIPASLNHEINISMNARFTYDLVLPLPSGGEITIPSISTAGGTSLPLCAVGGQYITKSDWSIFNVVDSDVYSQGEYYNIPTQVVGRVGNLSVVAYEANSSIANNTETPDVNSTTLVGIDMIDASSYQSVESACTETSTSKGITPIIWMAFDGSSTIDFRQEIANAISDNRLDIATVGEYFPKAVQSAAFRVSYLTVGTEDEDLVKTEPVAGGNLKLLNFTELVQDIGTCKQPVKKFENSDLTTIQVPVACANAGNAGLTPFEMQRCMECLFGYNTNHVCSRDNFSIRPESFNVKINDTNQSNLLKTRLADTVTGVAAPSAVVLDLAAGYRYNFEANATSHTGNSATPGYTRYFNPFFSSESNATLLWNPTDTAVNPFCNDTNNTSLEFNMINGKIDALNDHKNVGEYSFNIVDKAWTKADWDINGDVMKHHRDNPGYYIGGDTGIDCDNTTSVVLPDASMETDATGAVTGAPLANINGCTIDTNNHDNIDANIRYRDYNLTFHPYDFNLTELAFQKGQILSDMNITADNAYVYQNNLSLDSDDLNMSVRYIGLLKAIGADGNITSNFVGGCYAKDLDLDLSTSDLNLSGYPAFSYRLRTRGDANTTIISDTIRGTNNGLASLGGLINLPDNNFTKAMKGEVEMELNLNFNRAVNLAINPIILRYNDLNASCNVLSECQSNADMTATYNPEGTVISNQDVIHLYGREHVPRHRVTGPNATVPIYYEFYCDQTLVAPDVTCNIGAFDNLPSALNPISPDALLSPDDVRWYIQTEHNVGVDGNSTFTRARIAADNANFNNGANMNININADAGIYTYSGTKGYPYKVTVEVHTPDWLIYNRYDGSATINNGGNNVNNFELEFSQAGNWAGQDRSGMEADSDASSTTNRRIQW